MPDGSLAISESNLVPYATTSSRLFDRQHALARLGGLEDVLHDVMELMTTESLKIYAEIYTALHRRDDVSLKRSAHTLKGSVSIFGAADLVRRLKHVEDCASTCDFGGAASELREISRQFNELQSLLSAELRRNNNSSTTNTILA